MKITEMLYDLATRIDSKRTRLAAFLYRLCTHDKNLGIDSIVALTNIYERRGKNRDAIDLLLKSDWMESYTLTYQLAYFRSSVGETATAIEMLEGLLARTDFRSGKADTDLVATLIELYSRQKEYEKALKLLARFEDGIRDQPGSGMVWFNVANIFIALGEFDKAIHYDKKALHTVEGMDTNVLYNIAHCYLQLKKYDEALSYFSNALRKANDKLDVGRAYFGLGCSYREKGDRTKARSNFELALANGYVKAEAGLREV